MKFILTMIICSGISGQCMPPFTFEKSYIDGYECMLDGYQKSYDRIEAMGKDEVIKHRIYIKFGCNEDFSNKGPTSGKPI